MKALFIILFLLKLKELGKKKNLTASRTKSVDFSLFFSRQLESKWRNTTLHRKYFQIIVLIITLLRCGSLSYHCHETKIHEYTEILC